MKKILTTLFMCIPAFAMNLQSTEDRLNTLEGNVKEIKKILDDERDDQGAIISTGLVTNVQTNTNILNGEKNIDGTIKSKGLIINVQDIQKILDDEKNTDGTIKSKGLVTNLQDIQKTLDDEKNADGTIKSKGLVTKVKDLETFRNTIETDVTAIKNILNDEKNTDGTIKFKGLVTKVSEMSESIEALNSTVQDHTTSIGSLKIFKNTIENSIIEIQDILYDKKNEEGTVVAPGLVTKVKNNTETLNSINESITSMAKSTKALTELTSGISEKMLNMQLTVATLDTTFNQKLEDTWRTFVEQKYQEYMNEKKQVQDIILSCKSNGTPVPTYIMETAEQLQACDLNTRRSVLSNILGKLNVFASLLDGEKIESIQNYLNITNVSQPQIQQVGPIMPGVELVGSYIRVSGATREFTRSAGFRTGLPKQNWMDPNYDYFPYGSRAGIEKKITEENERRQRQNVDIEIANASALAQYQKGIQAANGAAFPSGNFKDIVTDYNFKLAHHNI